jgi:hypothetical protein
LDAHDLQDAVADGTKSDRVHAALMTVSEARLRPLAISLLELLHEGGYFSGAHAAGSDTIDLLRKRLRPYNLALSNTGAVAGGSQLGVEVAAILDLPTLRDHIGRINVALVNDDAPLLLGSSKELLETTAKFVLDELQIDPPGEFPALLARALEALGLHAKGVSNPDDEVALPVRRILGALQLIAVSINDLRNLHGTGHGRLQRGTRLGLRQARLAAGSACVLASAMLDTFEDPGAPWRSKGSTKRS